jgi:hypothetical protein
VRGPLRRFGSVWVGVGGFFGCCLFLMGWVFPFPTRTHQDGPWPRLALAKTACLFLPSMTTYKAYVFFHCTNHEVVVVVIIPVPLRVKRF